MRINLCGTRGSTPAPGREFVRYGGHTSCLAITPDDAAAPELLLDAGTGIREVTRLLAGRPFHGGIAVTHLHWDHVQGLPFFVGGDRDDARVRLMLPEPENGTGAEAALERSLTLLARQIPHKGGRTFGYRVSDGHSSIAYLPDHSPAGLGPGPDGLGAYHAAAVELAAGVDVLLHDSFWLAEEFDPAATFGHAAAEYAVGLAARAGASQLVLVHHRPDRTDTELDKLAASLANGPVPVSVAFDGQVITL